MKKLKILSFTIAMMFAASCDINGFKEFSDYYIAFEPAKSSSTVINEQGSVVGQYMIHFCTAKRDDTVGVEVEVTPGDGLTEGVDYKVVSSTSVKFVPGVYDKAFIIEWLPHTLDASKDNTLTLTLHSCTDSGIILGVPGPSHKDISIKITKTK